MIQFIWLFFNLKELPMCAMNANKIKIHRVAKLARERELRSLITDSFDINNANHTSQLTKYMDEFDFISNQMHLYQALSEGIKAWGAIAVVGMLLPIPDFVSSIASTVFYLGVTGYILDNFRMTDFYNQLSEMETLYNWCLKGGVSEFSPGTNNDNKLANPTVQRLVRSLAPFCPTNFMIAWDRQTRLATETQSTSRLAHLLSAVNSTASFFTSGKSTADLTKITELKIAVEKGTLEVSVGKGFEQAIRYFVTEPKFRELMLAKLPVDVDGVKNFAQKLMPSGT